MERQPQKFSASKITRYNNNNYGISYRQRRQKKSQPSSDLHSRQCAIIGDGHEKYFIKLMQSTTCDSYPSIIIASSVVSPLSSGLECKGNY